MKAMAASAAASAFSAPLSSAPPPAAATRSAISAARSAARPPSREPMTTGNPARAKRAASPGPSLPVPPIRAMGAVVPIAVAIRGSLRRLAGRTVRSLRQNGSPVRAAVRDGRQRSGFRWSSVASANPASRSRWSGWGATSSAAESMPPGSRGSSMPPSMRVSPSSTPRTPTPAASPSGCSGQPSGGGGTRPSSPPRWAATWGMALTRPVPRAATSDRRWSQACSGWIDLYQIHFPDPDTPVEETLSALDDLVHEGKVRYIGCSNFSGWQIADADWTAYHHHLSRFISAQNDYSLLNRQVEAEVSSACEHFGLGLIPFFPLSRGLLTGRYQRGEPAPQGSRLSGPQGEEVLTDAAFDVIEGLAAFARRKGTDLLGVAIGGLAPQPAVVSVIAGASQPEQVLANVAAAEWEPTPEDLAELDTIAPSRRPASS